MHEGVCVVLKNNDISFNEVGLIFDGYGIIQDNKMWGNLHRSTIDLGKEALARAKVRTCVPARKTSLLPWSVMARDAKSLLETATYPAIECTSGKMACMLHIAFH